MSQHIFTVSDTTTAVVGYDRPLDDFFANVIVDGDVVDAHFGTTDLDELNCFLARHDIAVLTPDMRATLLDERVNRATHPMHKRVTHS
jgi:hypothetical protein